MIISKNFIIELLLLIFTKLVLDYAYIEFVYPLFEYAGFNYDFRIDKYFIGWIVYLLGYGILYIKKDLYISEIYIFIFLIYLLPNVIFYSLANQNTNYFLALTIPYFLIVMMTTNKQIFSISSFPNGKVVVLVLSFVIVLMVIVNYTITTGGKMVLNFSDVYEFRGEFGRASTTGIFGYLNSWAFKVFAVVLFAWSLHKRKLVLIAFSLGLILLLFSLSGHKGVLQSIVLVPFFYGLFKFKNRRIIIIAGFLLLISFVIIVMQFFDFIVLGSLVIRRLLFVPAHLNFTYIEFFSKNDFVYWSNSILKYFLSYPYDVRPVQVISSYLGKPDMAANTGFIASGFMQAGHIGISIYILIAILLFNIINNFAKRIDKYFVIVIMFLPINTLFVSADMFTVLLTHGLLVSVLVLWMYDKKKYTIKLGKYKYEI